MARQRISKKSKTMRLIRAKNKSLKKYQKINCNLRKTRVKENKCLKKKKRNNALNKEAL